MVNKYRGQCVDCAGDVPPGAGRAFKNGRRWVVTHADGQCKPLTFKQRYGHCEDAPCCGCCGGGNDFMSASDYNEGGY